MDVATRHETTENVAADLGVKLKEHTKVAQGLAGLMADTYLVYLKAQNFHRDVTDPMFGEPYALYEQQYGDLARGARRARRAHSGNRDWRNPHWADATSCETGLDASQLS